LKDEIVKKPINKKALKRKKTTKKKCGAKIWQEKPNENEIQKKISQTKTNFN
jgi:hypothetical protein